MSCLQFQILAIYAASNIETVCRTNKDDGQHVPTCGKHAGRTQHRKIEDLPTTPCTQPTESLVNLHTFSSSVFEVHELYVSF